MNFLTAYEKGLLNTDKTLTNEDVLKILQLASELKKKNMELEERIEELEEELEERGNELEGLKRDPRKCSCGYIGDYVLINGRCSSCM